MAVILEVPVLYNARIVRHGCRLEDTRQFQVVIPVAVPELSADEAPVALRAVFHNGETGVYRQHDGVLMRHLALKFRFGRTVYLTDENAQAALNEFMDEGCYHEEWTILPRYISPPWKTLPDGERLRRLIWTEREAAIQEMREHFQRYSAFVEGELFVRSLGPGWAIKSSSLWGGYTPHLYPEYGHILDNPRFGNDWTFPWDQLDAARRQAQETNVADENADTEPLGRVFVEALKHDHDSLHLEAACAAEGLLVVLAKQLPSMSPEAIQAYGTLKAMVKGEIAPEAAAPLLMAVRELYDHWNRHYPVGHRARGPIDPVEKLLGRLDRQNGSALDLSGLDLSELAGEEELAPAPGC